MKTKYIFISLVVFCASWSVMAKERSISVNGHCLISVKPDRGSIDFFAEAKNNNAQKALHEATELFQKARASVQKLNLKGLEFETIENTVMEERVWENNSNVFKGYRARVGLKVFTKEIDKLGEVIQVVSAAGVKNISQLVTDISPAKLKEEQEACLEQAIVNAKSKALKMAKAAGANVGRAILIKEGGEDMGHDPRPMPFARSRMKSMEMGVADASVAPIDVRNMDVSMNVHVIYLLE